MIQHTATSIREASQALREDNDCTVRAIAVSTGVHYNTAHAALAARGRRKGRGAYEHQWLPAIEDVGFLYVDVTHQFTGKTCRSIEPELRRAGGRYIVKVSRHAMGFDGEKFVDWAAGRLKRIVSVYSILEVGAVANHVKPEPVKVAVEDTSKDEVFITYYVKRNGSAEWRIMLTEGGKTRWLNMKNTEAEAYRAATAAARKRRINYAGHK